MPQRRLSAEQKRNRAIMRRLEDRLIDLNKKADDYFSDLVFDLPFTEEDRRYRPATVNAEIEKRIAQIDTYVRNLSDAGGKPIVDDVPENYDRKELRAIAFPTLDDAKYYQEPIAHLSIIMRYKRSGQYFYRVAVTVASDGKLRKDKRKHRKRRDKRKNAAYRNKA